jgi:glycosyltransferase involved in cell wall biosynthesis
VDLTPAISIITPCLNRAAFVTEAVESVRRQRYPAVEHIIMDGGSTDGTLEVLKQFPEVQVRSEPDKGLYDALNKGLRLASGEIVGFLNTDDLYEPDTFGDVAQLFRHQPEIDAIVGGATIFRDRPQGEEPLTVAAFGCIRPGELLWRATRGAPIFNAWFFRKRLLDNVGDFDNRYPYVADRDLLIRMALRHATYACLDKPLYRYRMHAGSFTLSGKDSGEDPWMFDSRSLAERYLARPDLPRSALRCFKVWHSQITSDHIITAWHTKGYRRIPGYVLTGVRYNLGWPVVFAGKAWERLTGAAPAA